MHRDPVTGPYAEPPEDGGGALGPVEEHAVRQLLLASGLPTPGEGDPRRLRLLHFPGVICML
ncbi:hypothetical protein Stube_39530 [Streptomyces tubercidicus]|uniref:Uncharacterized protein n=1 Tax=Streptomyces tubercidicus TaxID=47759 RepID=A0A640UV39_9ACTN|nr:hypothetical protein Stube_39530 [Streptomyces tubercidicus]